MPWHTTFWCVFLFPTVLNPLPQISHLYERSVRDTAMELLGPWGELLEFVWLRVHGVCWRYSGLLSCEEVERWHSSLSFSTPSIGSASCCSGGSGGGELVFMTTLNQLEDMARLQLSPFAQLKEGAPTLVDGAALQFWLSLYRASIGRSFSLKNFVWHFNIWSLAPL